MDPEQTFIRVQERFSQMLTPKVRAALEYIHLFIAITLFCVLVVMHANYVQQPGCSSELCGIETTEAQLIQIKITSAGLWLQNESDSNVTDVPSVETEADKLEATNVDEDGLMLSAAKSWSNWIGSNVRKGKLALKFWKTDTELVDQAESSANSQSSKPMADDAVIKIDKEQPRNFPLSAKESFKAAITHFGKKWYRRLYFIWRHAMQISGSFQKLWNISGIHLNLDVPKWLHILYLDRINSYAVQWLENRSRAFEPTYLYTMEKGYFLLPESARSQHNIHTVNISISARHSCFGNRWQQLVINRFVGYDTILMNSLLNSPGQGYLFNYQTKEFYNLSYAQEPPEGSAKFGEPNDPAVGDSSRNGDKRTKALAIEYVIAAVQSLQIQFIELIHILGAMRFGGNRKYEGRHRKNIAKEARVPMLTGDLLETFAEIQACDSTDTESDDGAV